MVKENVNKVLEEKIASFKPGSLIKGRVVDILNEEVIIDIGFKSEGVTSKEEFKGRGNELKKGEEVYVVIESLDPDSNGLIPLSKEKADIMLYWEQLEEKFKNNVPVEGVIFKRVKGGYRVDIGVTAFLPSSQTDIVPIKNPNEYVGMKTFFKILKFDSLRKNVVVSRKQYLEEEKERQKIEYLKSLSKNQLVKGVVKNIVDYGAFIEIEHEVVGLLHINDMSWGRISHPSQLLSIGEKVEVVVLDINFEKQVVSFGLKQKTQNPWDKVEEKYPVGSIVEGKVVNITEYGVFIKLEEGVEGLLHISELSWTGRIKHPSEVVATGDTLKVKVIDIKKEEQKISFSLRQLEPNPWPEIEKKYPVGTIVTGKVYHITDFGAFVEIEKGIDGLLHISNISDTPIKHPSEVLRKGQKVELMILEIDPENKKISLGMKQLGESFKDKKRRKDESDNNEEL
ncbi:MAG TPA: 30S ribosomal protein S1 [bacterium]|nr:30S ribosomal protein S1 [bacterium]HOM26298.1 30S ribosomal protein S1 [bacterium]